VVVWISASLDVAAADLDRETEFWSAVTGGPLPAHLVVRASTGPAGTRVHLHDDDRLPEVPAPAAFPGVRRSRVYQVCLDLPGDVYDAEARHWEQQTGGRIEVLERRPEFAWLRIPGGPRPLDLLLQRLDRHQGPAGAHLDLGTPDRPAERLRHLALGASLVADEEFWTVLADPAGAVYCITDRDPATGKLG
jgi:hypothetical protein